jgi:hypothetical protein
MTPIPDSLFYQPYIYDAYACRSLVLAVIARHMRVLRSCCCRSSALVWFEGGDARLWCQCASLPMDCLFDRVEQELDCEPVDYGARRRGK